MKITSHWLPIGLSLFIFIGCQDQKKENEEPSEEQITAASGKLDGWFQEQWEEELSFSPELQTYIGVKTDYDKWNDRSREAEMAAQERVKRRLGFLRDSVAPGRLDEATQMSYSLYLQQLEDAVEDFKYRLYDYPVDHMRGIHSQVPSFLINMHQIRDKADAEAYISRVRKVPQLFSQIVEGLKEREEAGIVPPAFVYPLVREASDNILRGQPFSNSGNPSTLLADFQDKTTKLALPEPEKKELTDSLKAALLTALKPAYEDLMAFMDEQEKRATTDDGVWKFPEGEAFYANALKRTTTTDMNATEIHELGLSEVERIHGEMNVIREKVGFKGTLPEFFDFMREDAQFYYPDTEAGREQYIEEAVRLIDSMRTRLDELFLTKPKADIIVKQVEPFREKSAGLAFYQSPALDGSRPGIYYANLYDIKAMPKYQMESLAYHEGIPGHHMQRAIAQELEGIPMFRKFSRYTAYTEGWGLYSELIPKEMGFYRDPYSDFGRLAAELWRACRLVVDTGIHAKKWTREEGIDYYRKNTPNAESDAVNMVERHIVMPSQATAYKVGMNKIVALRDQAREKLGEKFDIREYHEVVLTDGPLPLNVLEEKVAEWIASK